MKHLLIAGVVVLAVFFSYCNTAKKATASKATVTYEAHIQPIIATQCAPCHIPDKGRVMPLNTYEAVSGVIDDIIVRIEKLSG